MNNKKNTISIVGQGFVGTAVREGMKKTCDVYTYDKFKPEDSNVEDVAALVRSAPIIFVCVPTPMQKNGRCDISIVESVVKEIDDAALGLSSPPLVVIKSTIPPGTTDYLDLTFHNINVAFNPEFLREATPFEDFRNQNRIILGGNITLMVDLTKIYRDAFPGVPIIAMEATAAELVKYVTNTFLATKVSFFNEIYQICEKLDVSYNGVIEAVKFDDRIGKSHMQVPGPMPDHEGNLKFGFSGSCFVKDINALMFLAKKFGVDTKVMNGAWEKNLEVRPEKDWEKLIGRAVSE